jgi:hypothetical protein
MVGETDKCKYCKTSAQMTETREKEIASLQRKLVEGAGEMTRKARVKCEKELKEACAKHEEHLLGEEEGNERRRLGFLAYISRGPKVMVEKAQVWEKSPGMKQGRRKKGKENGGG